MSSEFFKVLFLTLSSKTFLYERKLFMNLMKTTHRLIMISVPFLKNFLVGGLLKCKFLCLLTLLNNQRKIFNENKMAEGREKKNQI
jgi:hypothetical protein